MSIETPNTSSGHDAEPLDPLAGEVVADHALPVGTEPGGFCHRCGAPLLPGAEGCACLVEKPAGRAGASPLRDGSIKGALALYFTLLVTLMVVFIDESVELEMATGVIHAVVVLVWCAVFWKLVRPGLVMPAAKWWAWSVPLSVVTFAVAYFTTYPLVTLLDLEEISYSTPYLDAGYGWWMVVLFVCVQPAVFEELAFRGVILKALTRVLSTREAVVVSALLFMSLHLAVPSFPHLLFTGLVLGWLRVRSGSILPGVVLHFCHNLFCLIFEAYGL